MFIQKIYPSQKKITQAALDFLGTFSMSVTNKTRNISLLPLWTVSAQQAPLPVPVRPIPKQEQESLSAPGPDCLCQAGTSSWLGGSV